MCLGNCRNFYLIFIIIKLCCMDVSVSSVTNDLSCFQRGPCNCTGYDGERMDLSPLSIKTIPLMAASTSYFYMYHPCTDISLDSVKPNTCSSGYGVCLFVPLNSSKTPITYSDITKNSIEGNFTNLASNKLATILVNENKKIDIVFKNNINGKIVVTTIKLRCNEEINDYNLSVDNNDLDYHVLVLTSKYACILTTYHMSSTALFFLILFIFVAVYFIGGILVLKFLRGATGIEMIPNHEFWRKIPQYAKGGFTYLTSCGKSPPDTYETI